MYSFKERGLASLTHLSMPLANILYYLFWQLPSHSFPVHFDKLNYFELNLLSLVFNPYPVSPLFCALLWVIYRKQNSWISMHALQAVCYQIISYILLFLMILFAVANWTGVWGFRGTMIVSALLYFACPIHGSIKTFKEQVFNYLLIGEPIKRRGFKNFLKKFALYCLPVFILAFLAIWFLPKPGF